MFAAEIPVGTASGNGLYVRSRQDGADLPTVTHASKPRPVAATMVAACPAPARPGIGRDQHRDRRVARFGVVGPTRARPLLVIEDRR
jgi:hypothetical protein